MFNATVVVLLVCVYVCVCVCVHVCVHVCVCVCDSEIKTPVKNELQLGTANTGGGEALRSTLVGPREEVVHLSDALLPLQAWFE
jgi:hypothetical protein